MDAFTYESGKTPKGYKCKKCKATGCKLWRQYQTFLNHIDLLCMTCAEENQETKCELEKGGSDAIGWLIAAVPTEDGDTFWGYTSIPAKGCDWWDELPNRLGEKSPVESLTPQMRRRYQGTKDIRDYLKEKLKKLATDVSETKNWVLPRVVEEEAKSITFLMRNE